MPAESRRIPKMTIESQPAPDRAAEPLRGQLEKFGDAHKTAKWETGEIDYVARLGLTATDVPELLTIAREWTEAQEWPDDEGYVAGYAPIHAWRGLAQLRAAEAVPVLLEMLDPLDKDGDDWFLEEFPHAFAWIGPAAVPSLRDYLADSGHEVFARICAAHSLQEVAARHPHVRDEVVKILADALSRFADTDEGVNAYVVTALVDLKATEAAEVIERAHAADRVDVFVNGNWNDVRKELGVPGLGLVPEELANQKWGWVRESEDGSDDTIAGGAYVPVDEVTAPIRSSDRVGRNEPCPCGSGKKYKKCCGR
jgi:hypothetical protein